MCQKYPGPRCTPHVRARLDRARRRLDAAQTLFDANPADTRNRQRLDIATTNLDARSAEYDATPGGQTELRTQLGAEDDPGKREQLQRRLETGKALRQRQIRSVSEFTHDDSKDNSHDRERDTDPDTGATRSVLAAQGMDAGTAGQRTDDDRTGMGRPGDRGSRSPRLLIGDRKVVPTQVHTLDTVRASQLRRRGDSTPDLYELASSDADLYREQMEQLKGGNRFASSVHIYSDDEYANMRLFVTDDGRSGIALNDDEIVSAFSHRDSKYPSAAKSMLAVAVQQGGRRLDCFDTALPRIYSEAGFVPVARLKWNDDYAPDDWNCTVYSRYNGGRPDVVFMAHDHAALDSRYVPGSGLYVDSYGDGINAVRARMRTSTVCRSR